MTTLARLREEEGSSTTELVLLMPVVLLTIMLSVQAGLYFHARHVITAAAQDALEAAQVEGGDAAAGRADAETLMAEAGGVRSPVIEITRTADEVQVHVSAAAPNVVPGAIWQVTATAYGPVERFVPETDR